MTSLPSVQLAVMLTNLDEVWADTHHGRHPVLGIKAGSTELCLVLPTDAVTATDITTARLLAEVARQFADEIEQRHVRRHLDRGPTYST